MIHGGTSRRVVVVALLVVLVTAMVAVDLATRARGAEESRCDRFAVASLVRSQLVTGSGAPVVVIGDSYSAGLGLDAPDDSWPSRLDGMVHVDGFSGSGFSAGASSCGDVSFAERAEAALRSGADLVVVEGGLNDVDQSEAAIRAGFALLLGQLSGHRVVIVGLPSAPARASAVPRVDRLLAKLAQQYDASYVRTSGWTLPYLPDQLHLTRAGHRTFGDNVARPIAAP